MYRGGGFGPRRHRGGKHDTGRIIANTGPRDPALPPPLRSQSLLQSLTLQEAVIGGVQQSNRISEVELVTTYNWTQANEPTIKVPGRPPTYRPSRVPQSLQEDTGVYYRDVNSAYYPPYPTAPAVQAIQAENPSFSLSSVDVFGCGNTVGSLLSFAREEERTFRFGVELLGSTLFLVRKTDTPREIIGEVRGYGHAFPEAYTVWNEDVKGSVSHQRVIRYKFAGLEICVRSECDGYLPDVAGGEEFRADHESQEVDGLDLGQVALNMRDLGPLDPAKLNVEFGGQRIPQHAVFDLKTRSKRKTATGVSVDDFLHRLWVNQTPYFIMALHTHGRFHPEDIHVVDAAQKIKNWEAQHGPHLSTLGGTLHRLSGIARSTPNGKYEIRRVGTGPLEIYSEDPAWSALPSELRSIWGASTKVSSASGFNEDACDRRSVDGTGSATDDDADADYLKFV
ncbi:hypothetical protein CAC42_4668 [Sphaceloma murrayae]|uniref:Geranylgeranyl pyrophosphate synthetase n=1 Tax=Sphaceloma murrayae TaxID=2082308 RepID=A0A2K1QNK3_9PEZI|nr:hypothetical protein CAC42_4668 [Sphaceloma murrayae]